MLVLMLLLSALGQFWTMAPTGPSCRSLRLALPLISCSATELNVFLTFPPGRSHRQKTYGCLENETNHNLF